VVKISKTNSLNSLKKEKFMKDKSGGFWSFDKMITVKIIPIAFIITLIINAILGIFLSCVVYNLTKSTNNDELGYNWVALIAPFLTFVLYNAIMFVLMRLAFETMIILFKIWENTKHLRS
jgi:Domain of unknown function (DUF4282)